MAEKKAPASDTHPGDSGSSSTITPQAIAGALLAVDGLGDTRRPFADGASILASAGLHVFPLDSAKEPMVKWGKGGRGQRATTDPDVVAWWARKWPAAGVGIACQPSGLLVIDLDIKHPPVSGPVSWSEVTWASGDLEAAPACYYDRTTLIRTSSGGLHLWFADPGGTPGRIGMLPGIDAKGAGGNCGGFAVAPPTPGYEVLGLKPPAPKPRWVVQALTHPKRPEREWKMRHDFGTDAPPTAVAQAVSPQTREALAAALRKRRRS